ncbi:MAG: hydroxylamine reductase, partial [Halobacteriales archaeon]
MNCSQCEWTRPDGCEMPGVCGKDPDLNSIQETILYGVKGVSAYATHAREAGYVDPDVDATVHEALYSTLTNVDFSTESTLETALDVGEAAVDVMELLDDAHTEELGTPRPTEVPQNDVEGHSILVTGHDLFMLEQLLEQSKDEGVNVYTHSEMLPAHGYPELAKYDHLKGNVGGAWHDQRRLFEEFPGAILGTSNCLQPPTEDAGYVDRFYTAGVTALEGVQHLENDFSPLVETAKETPKANWDSDETLSTGFYHETVL